MPSYSPFLLAILITAVIFISAMKNGVVKVLSSGIAAFFAIIILLVTINILPGWAESTINISFTWKLTVIIAVVLAAATYLIARFIAGVLVNAFFNPDKKRNKMAEGISGGVISLFPSLVVVLFLFVCVRIIGTAQELNYITSLSQPGIGETSMVFPEWPDSTQWRDSLEKVDLLSSILDLAEPFSRRENRNLGVLVIMKQSSFVSSFLNTRKKEGALINQPHIVAVSKSKAASKALAQKDQLGLVLAPAMQETASNALVKSDLQKLEVRQLVEDFIASLPQPLKQEETSPTN